MSDGDVAARADQPGREEDARETIARADARRLGVFDRIKGNSQIAVLVATVLFTVVVAVSNPNFLTYASVVNILRDASFLFIVAVAATFVLVGGGLDLSVGSVFALSSVSSAMLLVDGVPVPLAFLLGVGVGATCGLVNSVIVIYGRIPPLIVTLGMMYVARGLDWIVTAGRGTQYLPPEFGDIASARVLGLPLVIVYALLIGLVAHVILERTRFGFAVRATGGNREAARACGVNVTRTTFVVFVASGVAAGLSGVLMASNLHSGQPSIGQGFELQVITAAIIGGTSLFGGLGSIPGTLLGTMMIAILNNGLVSLEIDPLWQNVVIGVVLVSSVGLDQLRRARMWRTSAKAAG
jgi:ribose/xylose/arabinose/galactoside ABC-type transport system permease subunit